MQTALVALSVLKAWHLEKATCTVVEEGLINQTFLLQHDKNKFILQKLHPIFTKEVHQNIAVLTEYLKSHSFRTPELVPTIEGELEHEEDGAIWRVLSFVPGQTFSKITHPEQAYEAGILVGRFHHLLADFSHGFISVRDGVHDTDKHLAHLDHAMTAYKDHRLYKEALTLYEEIGEARKNRLDFKTLALRPSHGDLKISNLMFDAQGKGLCLIDLDTLGQLPWAVEMADAFRSWCAPCGEDDPDAYFDAALFESALKGYFSVMASVWTSEEKSALIPAIETICLELSVRFLADALVERYFGFDEKKYVARGEHNLARALGQWRLFCSVRAQKEALEHITTANFSN
jgi:Ser/Thr protein kinase RdoA (MazF antagonist)